MAEKLEVCHFTKTLIDVNKKLQSIDIQRLVFLCRDLIAHHDLDKINTGMELFQALEQEKHIQRDVDISLLLEILHAARRVDLSDDVAAKMNGPKFTADTKRAISRYRYLMLEIAMTLSDQEIDEVTFMAAELLGCAKDNIQDIYQLLVLLEGGGHISAGNVRCLHQDLITHQLLNKKIKEYEEDMKQVLKEEEKGRKSYVEGCMQGTYHTLYSERDNMAEGAGTTHDDDSIITENRNQELQPCSDQADDIAVPSSEQQHQTLLPAQAALPASITAENVNQGETQNVVSGDQTYIQHVDRHIERNIETNIERNIETNIETQVVYNIGDEKKDNSNFNLESVRRQLKDEYLETRGKLPLLPGMPEEFANMEDLFVDLHIVEEEKKPDGVFQKELNSHGDLVCITQEVEKGGKKEKREVKRILVRGKPGIGKSSTVSKLAYDWACSNQDSPISKFQLLFAVTIHEINANTDLIGVIQDQLLPKVSRQGLEDYLQLNASSVVILLDGYDEASKHFHQSRDIKNVLCSKWLSEACVIVTTRPNQVGKFTQNYGAYLQVEILGFSDDERKKLYVERFMKSDQKSQEFLDYLDKSSLEELASIPIILSMLCLLWAENQKLPSTVTALYKAVITHLAKHSYSKTATDDPDMEYAQIWIDSVLNQMGEVALEGLFEDRLVFSSHKFKPKNLEEACTLGVVTKEKKRSGLTVTYNVTFLHKTFQEFCAAHFWVGLIENDEEKFSSYLKKVDEDKLDEMEHLLRFLCGLSLKAAGIVLPHLVHIMCQHLRYYDGDVEGIYDDESCQQFGISLLHEAESNNAQIGQCIELHKHLKPLIKTVKIEPSSWEAGEFHEILTSYISSAQSVANDSSEGCVWLNDVEEVYVYVRKGDDVDSMRYVVELICAMSRISNLHIREEYDMTGSIIEHLLSNNFSTALLSELGLENVECDINQFAKFLSTILSLNRFVLKRVLLKGDLLSLPTLPTVQGLHIADCVGMNSLLDVFIAYNFSSNSISELYCNRVECNADEFAQFTPCMSSLSKLDLDYVSLYGELSSSIHLPEVKELCIRDRSEAACKALLKGYSPITYFFHIWYSQAVMNQQNKSNFHKIQKSPIVYPSHILLESLKIQQISMEPDDLNNLFKAIKHMLHLRILSLPFNSLKPSGCTKLFHAFLDASGNMHICSHENKSGAGEGHGRGLVLEVLDLSGNEIGDSIVEFVKVYEHMPYLKCLKLINVVMEAHHCEKLFDGFIEARQTRNENNGRSGIRHDRGLVLEELDLSGNEIGDSIGGFVKAYDHMPHLKCLKLSSVVMEVHHCEKLFDGFIGAGQTRNDSSAFEVLVLSRNEIGDSVENLAQAYRYMTHLRCLNLNDTGMNPSQCAQLFDGFISVGKLIQSQHESEPCGLQSGVLTKHGLALEELDMSRNDIGESVGKLAKAYCYMTQLRGLSLFDTKLNPSHCAMLFDGFIAAGKLLTQDESSSNTQGDASSVPKSGLRIEKLDLSGSEIGESVDKLLEALKYMPHLKTFDVQFCQLSEENLIKISSALKTINKSTTGVEVMF